MSWSPPKVIRRSGNFALGGSEGMDSVGESGGFSACPSSAGVLEKYDARTDIWAGVMLEIGGSGKSERPEIRDAPVSEVM